MARTSTAHFNFDREAFERASIKLKERVPRAYNDRLMVEALVPLLAELKEKNYGDEEIVAVLAAEIEGGATEDDRKVLRALLRRARAAETAARAADKASLPKPRQRLQPSAARTSIKGAERREPEEVKTQEEEVAATSVAPQVQHSAPVQNSSNRQQSQNQPRPDALARGTQLMQEMAARRHEMAEGGAPQTDAPSDGFRHGVGASPSSGSFGN